MKHGSFFFLAERNRSALTTSTVKGTYLIYNLQVDSIKCIKCSVVILLHTELPTKNATARTTVKNLLMYGFLKCFYVFSLPNQYKHDWKTLVNTTDQIKH